MTDIIKNGTDDAKVSLDSDAGDPPAQILRTIQVVEEHLRVKRSRIEEIQTRHDGLVEELRKLNKTLESESLDFVSNLKAVIDDYDVGSAAEASRAAYQSQLADAGYGSITTEIVDAPTFYYAEDYHQQYLAKNPSGYCGLGGTGVSCPTGLAEAPAR